MTLADSDILSPQGIAIDWLNRLLYWTDAETKRIEVINLPDDLESTSDINRKTIIWDNLDLPRSIALAPKDGLMFWSDWSEQFPKIERCSMDGNPDTRVTLVDTEIQWPNGLTLDYENKRLFWVDAKLLTISAINWDGTDRVRVPVDSKSLEHVSRVD